MYKKSMPYQACTVQYICIANINLLTLKTDVEIKM